MRIPPGFLQQSIYGAFCSLVRRVNMPETSPEYRLRLHKMPKVVPGKSPGELPLAVFPTRSEKDGGLTPQEPLLQGLRLSPLFLQPKLPRVFLNPFSVFKF